jgi:hypothetical protein
MNDKRNVKSCFPAVFLICCLCALTLTVNGCAPLRKKFVRKKKQDAEQTLQFVPVLEPEDYPRPHRSAEERYKYHYSLWKVWHKDFLQSVESGGSDKRQLYLFNQTLGQLEEMGKWLAVERRAELMGFIEETRAAGEVYHKPALMRDKNVIRNKVESIAKRIRKDFSPGPSLSYQQENRPQ